MRLPRSISPIVSVGVLVALMGASAWLGAASAPSSEGMLAQAWTEAQGEQTASFVEATTGFLLDAVGKRTSTFVFNSSSTGTIDFPSESVALRTKVLQVGQPASGYESFLTPGTLYERVAITSFGRPHFGPWMEDPSPAEPLLSLPALAVLRADLSSDVVPSGHRQLVAGALSSQFLLPARNQVCVFPRGPVERFSLRITVWIDSNDRLRRVSFTENVHTVGREEPGLPTSLTTVGTLTLTDFGQAMIFSRPAKPIGPLGTAGSSPHPSVKPPSCGNQPVPP
jgi:hypothetical protein